MFTTCTTFSSNRRHLTSFTECTNVYHKVLSTTTVYCPKYMLMQGLCKVNRFSAEEIEFLRITYINFMPSIVKKHLIKHVSRTHAERLENLLSFFFSFLLSPMPPHVLMNFRGFPPGCGDSVADFWGWDAHEAWLHCPDDVSGDMQEDEIPGGALSLNLLTTQTMVTTGIFRCKEKFPW